MEKRPIDKLRDSAASFRLEADGDDTGIKEMLVVNDGLLLMTGNGIYEVKTADQIDPQRTNPGLPHNVQRRILQLGAESELVGKTLLTAKNLFVDKFLPSTIDVKKAMSLTFDLLKDLAEMQSICDDYLLAEKQEVERTASRSKTPGSFALPSVPDVDVRCKTFIQKAEHVVQATWDIVKLFHSVQSKCHFATLLEILEKQHGKDDEFTQFLRDSLPFLLLVRNTRNCLDHRNAPGAKVENFTMLPSGMIAKPTIEIIFRETNQPRVELAVFLPAIVKSMVSFYENLIAFLCAKCPPRTRGLPIVVAFIPENRRHNRFVQYGFGTVLNGEFVPIG